MRHIQQKRNYSHIGSELTIAEKQEILEDFKKTFHEKTKNLLTAVTIINCINESDEYLMKTGVQMLKSFDEELQQCSCASEMNELVDVEQLYDKWKDMHEMLNRTTCAEAIAKLFKQVSEMKE